MELAVILGRLQNSVRLTLSLHLQPDYFSRLHSFARMSWEAIRAANCKETATHWAECRNGIRVAKLLPGLIGKSIEHGLACCLGGRNGPGKTFFGNDQFHFSRAPHLLVRRRIAHRPYTCAI